MIDNYAIYGIVIRTIAAGVLVAVILMQIQQFKFSSQLNYLKRLLLATSIVLFFSNAMAIFLNLFRGADGNLVEVARQFGTIINSTVTLLVAIALYLIYKYRIDEGDE